MDLRIIKWWRFGITKDRPHWLLFSTRLDQEDESWIHLFGGILIRINTRNQP